MNVLVCGSRSITELFTVTKAMNDAPFDFTEIIHGGSIGVNQLAGQVAMDSNIPTRIFKLDWKNYGKRARIMRNLEIVKEASALAGELDAFRRCSSNYRQKNGLNY